MYVVNIFCFLSFLKRRNIYIHVCLFFGDFLGKFVKNIPIFSQKACKEVTKKVGLLDALSCEVNNYKLLASTQYFTCQIERRYNGRPWVASLVK